MNKTICNTVKIRAKYLCEYCLSPEYFSPDTFECDHILPFSKKGQSKSDNYALACSGCNGLKYDATHAFDPATGQIAPLFNPRLDIWDSHFCWNENFTIIIGISPIGRATVSRLDLNRAGVINLRIALRKIGEFPG